MDKPDRVEAGQWWRLLYSEMKDPVRIESTDIYGTMPVGVFDGGWSSASLIMRDGEYLGSGEHPEPSEWMIETLAEHVNAIVDRAAEPTGHARTLARHIVGGGHTRWNDIREGVLLERAVLSLYSILRKLGKW